MGFAQVAAATTLPCVAIGGVQARDTLALRTQFLVRTLHLGGTAPLPTHFEIAERVAPSAATGLTLDDSRTSARVVLLDETGRVLLLRGHDPLVPEVSFWFTVGGGVEPGEPLRAAAVREVVAQESARLDEQVLARLDGVLDGLRHLRLAGARHPTHPTDGGRHELIEGGQFGHAPTLGQRVPRHRLERAGAVDQPAPPP